MNKKKKNRPTLRFPEFDEEWEETTLGEVVIYKNGKSYENDICENGIINLITLNSVNIDGSLSKEHKKVNLKADLKKDDIIIILSDIAHGYFLGLSAVIPENDKFILNQRVGLLRKKIIINSYFLSTTINFNQSYFKRKGQGSSQQNLNKGDVLSFSFYLPCIEEQQKIAACLSSLDDLITAHQDKLTNLKAHKNGLLQNLFPKAGEKVPRLRFDGFEEDWEETTLGSCLDYEQPTKYLVNSTRYDDKYKTPVLTAGKTFILGYTDEKEGIFSENVPVIIFDDFTTASKFVDFPFKAKSSAMKILLAKKGNDIKFIFEAMQNIKFQVGTHQRHWISVYSKLNILIPRDYKEQQKIASCLSSLDDLISAQEEKIKQLQAHKKGLLQGLFPKS